MGLMAYGKRTDDMVSRTLAYWSDLLGLLVLGPRADASGLAASLRRIVDLALSLVLCLRQPGRRMLLQYLLRRPYRGAGGGENGARLHRRGLGLSLRRVCSMLLRADAS
jgi:hypothetical protein